MTQASKLVCVFVLAFGCTEEDAPPPFFDPSPVAEERPKPLEGTCDKDGEVRDCYIYLPDHGSVTNCFAGTQQCVGGFWQDCKPVRKVK
jgi:hypothetical protein